MNEYLTDQEYDEMRAELQAKQDALPAPKMSNNCKTCGIELVQPDSRFDEHCRVCRQAQETSDPKLKLFSAVIVYADRTRKGTWFTLLDTDETSAKQTCINQVNELNRYGPDRGAVGNIEITEIEGPFTAGQILHSEG